MRLLKEKKSVANRATDLFIEYILLLVYASVESLQSS